MNARVRWWLRFEAFCGAFGFPLLAFCIGLSTSIPAGLTLWLLFGSLVMVFVAAFARADKPPKHPQPQVALSFRAWATEQHPPFAVAVEIDTSLIGVAPAAKLLREAARELEGGQRVANAANN